MQFTAQGIPRAVLAVIRLGVGVSRRADMLDIALAKRWLVRRQNVRDRGSSLAGRKDNRGEGRERDSRSK